MSEWIEFTGTRRSSGLGENQLRLSKGVFSFGSAFGRQIDADTIRLFATSDKKKIGFSFAKGVGARALAKKESGFFSVNAVSFCKINRIWREYSRIIDFEFDEKSKIYFFDADKVNDPTKERVRP